MRLMDDGNEEGGRRGSGKEGKMKERQKGEL